MNPILRRVLNKLGALSPDRSETQTVLDDMVHDAYAARASDVNNSGIDGQVEALLDDLHYTPKELVADFEDRLVSEG